MILYFIRHGQTDYNLKNLIQGCSDTRLNETGMRQAEEVGELLREKHITWDMIYCSPLDRAQTTCEIATGVPRSQYIIDRRLREIEVGALAHTSMLNTDPVTVAFTKHPEEYVPGEGAESYQQMIDRVGEFLEDLRRSRPAEKILIACHRGPIQSVVMNLDRSIPIRDFRRIVIPNASCLEVELGEDDVYRVTNLYKNDNNTLSDEAIFFS